MTNQHGRKTARIQGDAFEDPTVPPRPTSHGAANADGVSQLVDYATTTMPVNRSGASWLAMPGLAKDAQSCIAVLGITYESLWADVCY
jgi:hypothetical protein